MLLNKEYKLLNERIIYETRPNIIFGCKKAIFAFILAVILLIYLPKASNYIGNIQVYLVKFASTYLVRYFVVAVFTIVLILLLYVTYNLIFWYYTEYTLTDSRIIIRTGLIFTKKNYMPYTTIQDINSSQSIIGRIFGVASISICSAYDSNKMELKNIADAKKVEEILFNQMNYYRFNFHHQEPFYQDKKPTYRDSYLQYDPYEPIGVEHNHHDSRNSYDVYQDPEDVITHNHISEKTNITIENSNDSTYDYREHLSNKLYHENVEEYFVELNKDQINNLTPKKEKNESLSKQKIIENHFDKFKL